MPNRFSASSDNAIRYADELASRLNARLVLFYNISSLWSRSWLARQDAMKNVRGISDFLNELVEELHEKSL